MIVLIGGAPGVGKSVVASALARHLDILRLIDLDILRDILRLQSREREDPVLFMNALNAWELHGSFSEKMVMDGFHAHIRQQLGLTFRLIDSYLASGKSAILHGTALLPSQTARYRNKDVHTFVIACTDEEAYRASFIELHKMRTGSTPRDIRIHAGWILHQNIVREAQDCGAQIIFGGIPPSGVHSLGREFPGKVVEQILGRLCS